MLSEPNGATPAIRVLQLPIPLTEEAIAQFMSQMSDTQVRSLLRDELNAKVSSPSEALDPGAQTETLAYHATVGATRAAVRPAQEFCAMIPAQTQSVASFTALFGADGWMLLLSILSLAAAIGYGLEKLF